MHFRGQGVEPQRVTNLIQKWRGQFDGELASGFGNEMGQCILDQLFNQFQPTFNLAVCAV